MCGLQGGVDIVAKTTPISAGKSPVDTDASRSPQPLGVFSTDGLGNWTIFLKPHPSRPPDVFLGGREGFAAGGSSNRS